MIIIMLLCCLPSEGGLVPFSPVVRDFSPSDYNGGRQNWSVTQSESGMIYVGNSQYLLEYDGHSWNRYPMPGKGVVRSVLADPDGRIYCGSFKEFGYFEKSGDSLMYHSVSDGLKDKEEDLSEVWNIIRDPLTGSIVFQTFNNLYIYDGAAVKYLDGVSPLNIIKTRNGIYSQLIGGDFVRLLDGGVSSVIPKKDLPGVIVAAFLIDGRMLLLTDRNGLFYREDDGRIIRFSTEADETLKNGIINRSVMTKDGCLVIGTIKEGVISMDLKGNVQWAVNARNQLNNNTTLGLLCDQDNNVWAALDDGLSFIDNSSGISVFRPYENQTGMIYDVLIDGGEMFLATNHAVYTYNGQGLTPVAGLNEQVWCLGKIGGEVVCGHNNGTYSIKNGRSFLISEKGGGTFCVKEDSYNGERWVIEGTYSYPCLFKVSDDGGWEYVPALENVRQMVSHLECDDNGNLWCSHFNGGMVQIKLSADRRMVRREKYIRTLGDVSDSLFSVMRIEGRIVFSNGKEFFTYDSLNDTIIPYSSMNSGLLPRVRRIHQAVHAGGSYYWLVSDKAAFLVECGNNSFTVVRTIPFSYFGIYSEERASARYDEPSGNTYLCLNNMLVRIRTKRFLSKTRHRDKELALVSIKAESRQGDIKRISLENGVRIDYRHNNLTFLLGYPVYNEIDTRFRFQMKGLSDTWVETDQFLQQEYARLHPGHYRLNVEAYSEDEVLKRMSFDFTIRPPWFLSWWMKSVYLLLIGLVMYLVYLFTNISVKKEQELKFTRQEMENLKKIEEQEKEITMMRQARLEEDLKSKSKELASTAMNLIAHQEILEALSKEIQAQRVAGGAGKKDLERLQRMIDNHLVSDKLAWDMFQANFDRIHEHFFRHLKENYPTLTPADLRLCAMLRMNLSTKEIANMLNLTVRGVESARYRLRRKLNLPSEDGLTDFLINFN